MERLTFRNNDNARANSCAYIKTRKADSDRLQALIDRLAAYEDTGLSPEDVAGLAQAKREGRLVELPCKVGDTVFMPNRHEVEASKVTEFYFKDGVWSFCVEARSNGIFMDYGNSFSFSEIGRYVYFTREEAETALAKGDI